LRVHTPYALIPRALTTILAQTRKIQLADPKEGERDLPIEVLIGRNDYWRIVKDASKMRLSSSTVLLPAKFCSILTGNRTGITANEIMVNHVSLEHLDNDLLKFWDLGSIGITPNQQKPLKGGDFQIHGFRDSYLIEDGRRVVRLRICAICL
jgi:hypothetical protein